MTDWRTQPRTGKSQFYPLIDEIQARLKLGETYKQIHDELVATSRITLGYKQFAKYMKKVFGGSGSSTPSLPQHNASTAPTERLANPLANLSGPAEKRRDPDSSFHNSVPDKKRIYGE